MKQLLLILLLCTGVWGTDRTVGSSGNYATVNLAVTAAANWDTITLLDPSSELTAAVTLKKGLRIRSEAGERNTIALPITTGVPWIVTADSIIMDSVRVEFNLGTPVGTGYAVRIGGNTKYNRFYDCVFSANGRRLANMRGVVIDETANTTHEFYNCEWLWLYNGIGTITGVSRGVKIEYGYFYESQVLPGADWHVKWTIFHHGLENAAYPNATRDTFSYCWFNGSGQGAEVNTYEATRYNENILFYRCVTDSNVHAKLMYDQARNSKFRKLLFCNNRTDTGTAIYNHCNDTTARDTAGYNCEFDSITVQGAALSFFVADKSPALDSVFRLSFKNSVVLGGNIQTYATREDSVYNIYFAGNQSIAGIDYIRDTLKNRGTSNFINTLYFPYHKPGTPGSTWGYNDTLIHYLQHANTITQSSVKIKVQLDNWFRHWHPTVTKNNWWLGDTASVKLLITTDTINGPWTEAYAGSLPAGDSVEVSISGLDAATKYFYRTASVGSSAQTTNVRDTSRIFEFTTEANSTPSDTAKIGWISPATGNIAGGGFVDLICNDTSFGTTGTVTVDNAPTSVLSWSPVKVRIALPAHAAGQVNVILTPSGYEPDTIGFTYQAAIPIDTIFVDSSLSAGCATYNPTTRSCVGGTYKAYPTLQGAVDAMNAGNHIILRGGTYIGATSLPRTKSGTGWTDGYYNLIASYAGEWAILDGNYVNTVVLGNLDFTGDGYAHNYWKFKRIEVRNARSADGANVAAFMGNDGPFWFDSCVFHDNYTTLRPNPGLNNPGAIKGYNWEHCIIEHCYFYRNGTLRDTLGTDNHNCADIQIFSSYTYASVYVNGFKYNGPGTVRRSNIYRYNYGVSGHGVEYGSPVMFKDKAGEYFMGKDSVAARYNDWFKDWGDEYYYNVSVGHFNAYNIQHDFVQIHDNIIDSCTKGVVVSEVNTYQIYKAAIYNNTIINSSQKPIETANVLRSYTTTPETMLHYYCYNNILDSGVTVDTWNGEEITATADGAHADLCKFDSTYISHNYSYRPSSHTGDLARDKVLFVGNGISANRLTLAEYNTRYGRSAVHYNQNYDMGNVLWIDRYTPNGMHTVDGTHTLYNAGINTAHPYLTGKTIPAYIGATDPLGDWWVGGVLALENLSDVPPPAPISVSITSHPDTTEANDYDSIAFGVVATGSDLTYQWFKGSDTIVGATSDTVRFQASILDSGMWIWCIVRNETSVDTSDTAMAVIHAVAPTILTQPRDTTILFLGAGTIAVAARGTGPLFYEWTVNGVVNAASDSFIVLPGLLPDQADTVSCMVFNPAVDTAYSDTVVMTTLYQSPVIISQPKPKRVRLGTTATFDIVATGAGSGSLSYQWQVDSVDIVGATDTVYTTPAVDTSYNGNLYRCLVIGAFDTTISNNTTLKVGGLENRLLAYKQAFKRAFKSTFK